MKDIDGKTIMCQHFIERPGQRHLYRRYLTCRNDAKFKVDGKLLCRLHAERGSLMLPMESAPKTGKHILLKVATYGFNFKLRRTDQTGYKWIEGWWPSDEEGWQEWCGSEKTRSTGLVIPCGWAPIPGEPVE